MKLINGYVWSVDLKKASVYNCVILFAGINASLQVGRYNNGTKSLYEFFPIVKYVLNKYILINSRHTHAHIKIRL